MAIVETRAITGGVDTHADLHVAAALDSIGGLLGVREFPVSGSTRSMWRRAAACIARMGLSSAGLEILNKKRCPAAVSTRKFWSRSPARGLRDNDSTPKPSRRICLAACSPKAGGVLSKGSGRFTIGPEGYLAAGRPATARPRCRLPTGRGTWHPAY
jgi:hypothetical protein